MPLLLAERFWAKVDKNGPIIRPELGPCWTWTGAISASDNGGYGRIGTGNKTEIKAHRLSWILAGFEIPEGACVLHKCDNRACVNPDHLYLGTKQTNTQDMYDRGRRVQNGENNGNHKLTEQQILEITRLLNSGFRGADIAMIYGVARQTVYKIKHGQKWNYLTGATK